MFFILFFTWSWLDLAAKGTQTYFYRFTEANRPLAFNMTKHLRRIYEEKNGINHFGRRIELSISNGKRELFFFSVNCSIERPCAPSHVAMTSRLCMCTSGGADCKTVLRRWHHVTHSRRQTDTETSQWNRDSLCLYTGDGNNLSARPWGGQCRPATVCIGAAGGHVRHW